MNTSTRGRLVAFVALATLGSGVAFAVTDQDVVSSRSVEPKGDVYPPLDKSVESADAAHEVLGAQASSSARHHGGRTKSEDAKRREGDGTRRDEGAEGGEEAAMLAALIPAGSNGGDLPLGCGDAGSCVNRVGRLITDASVRLPDVPLMRECVSSIGGQALCFDFGGGNYLVADGPADGVTELGFCTSTGYYHVNGPFLDGGVGATCPHERPRRRDRLDGRRRTPPTAHDCKSLSGGNAVCFDVGRGQYIVSDSNADGAGELGFCSNSGYYYVSAPSGEGAAGVQCPGAGLD